MHHVSFLIPEAPRMQYACVSKGNAMQVGASANTCVVLSIVASSGLRIVARRRPGTRTNAVPEMCLATCTGAALLGQKRRGAHLVRKSTQAFIGGGFRLKTETRDTCMR